MADFKKAKQQKGKKKASDASAKAADKNAQASNRKASRGLGRGFDSLIPTNLIQDEFDPTHQQDRRLSQTRHLLIQDIKPNPEQPRREFKEEALRELADSIGRHGVVQPIVVVENDNHFLLIAGERRWRAAQMAGLDKIPALIRKLDDQAKLEIALIENLQREDLTALEMATAFFKLQQQFNMTPKQIGERVGKADSTVKNVVRLLKLPEPAKRALNKLRITEQHARAILSLDGEPQKQQELLDLILRHNWTATKAEQFVKAYKEGAATPTEAKKRTMDVTPETKAISKKIKAPVTVRHMAKGGRLIIQFKDDKDFERLAKLLGE